MKVFTLAQFQKWGAAGGHACTHRFLPSEKSREMIKARIAARARQQEEAARAIPYTIRFPRKNELQHAWFGKAKTLCGKMLADDRLTITTECRGLASITCRRCRGKLAPRGRSSKNGV